MILGKMYAKLMQWMGGKEFSVPYIKNIVHEKVLPLAEEIAVQPGQIVSKTLAQNEAVSLRLFAFSKGEEISTHDSEGDVLVMSAKIPHAVYAVKDFKWLLTVVFPEK